MTQIIQSNRERKSRLDEGLVDRLNNTELTKIVDIDVQDDQMQDIYDNKPSVSLRLKEKAVVRIKKQEEYDILMQICESTGMIWAGGPILPTDTNNFEWYKSRTCIDLNNGTEPLLFGDQGLYSRTKSYADYKRYAFDRFITAYDIGKSLPELNAWFDKHKPDRRSLG